VNIKAGTRLGRYEISAKICEGGMARSIWVGRPEETLKQLERAYDYRSDNLVLYVTTDPQMEVFAATSALKI
jgi:hypothetical protein